VKAAKSKDPKALLVKLKDPKDWQWIALAADGDEYAQARLADLLGWSGDDDQLAKVREQGADYAIVEIEIDGSVYARYRVK
jgi:hypothetical protein